MKYCIEIKGYPNFIVDEPQFDALTQAIYGHQKYGFRDGSTVVDGAKITELGELLAAQKPPAAEPEVSPTNELKALEALEQMVASARTRYSRNHGERNPSPAFPYEVVLSPANYAVLQSATKVVAEALRERAASTAPGWIAALTRDIEAARDRAADTEKASLNAELESLAQYNAGKRFGLNIALKIITAVGRSPSGPQGDA